MNRLGEAQSPYLQQHAGNPVDWWEWGPAAFAEAERRDVPVLISVGYAACHWCHVMAHESFEDDGVARIVNATTVPIKVDREERPDVDAVYMEATQAMTGQGGWPMTVFATPDGQPFHCGTYYPREVFTRLLRAVEEAWRDRRDAVVRQGAAVVEALAGPRLAPGGGAPLTAGVLDSAALELSRGYDANHGGFGGAPKFPPSMCLEFLLRHHHRTGDEKSLEMVRHTAERMARGGMYDQLAGGFARYSVDATWTVPHFEKMLYDNALLLRLYTNLWKATGDVLAERVARETAAFIVDGMATVEGAFISALDADTDGVEGATYVWTPAQLRGVVGDEDGAWAAELFGVTEEGTFEHGTSVLQLAADPAEEGREQARYAQIKKILRDVRDQHRAQPARDEKVVAAWNGLAITALAEFARVATADQAGAAAVGAGRLLARVHIVDGRLRRVSRDGVVGEPAGVLEDYGCVAAAFCALHQLTGEGRWLDLAGQLLDTALARFGDGDGGFFDTADDAERLVRRPQDPTDNATPSGLSSLAEALVTYTALTGETRYREAAERALAKIAPIVAKHPRAAGMAAAVGEALRAGPLEIAIATEDHDAELVAIAHRTTSPGAVVVVGAPDAPGVPLLAGRAMIAGSPTAYTCRGFVCDRPVTSANDFARAVAGRHDARV